MELARELIGLFSAFVIPVILVGFSQGANIALMMGRSHAREFAGVVPVCGHWEADVADEAHGRVRLTGLLSEPPRSRGILVVAHGLGGGGLGGGLLRP